jgi:hypothetical protein
MAQVAAPYLYPERGGGMPLSGQRFPVCEKRPGGSVGRAQSPAESVVCGATRRENARVALAGEVLR